jgi:CRP/FNR family transcriptional regulator, cyclic AMP receptor protein
MRTFKGPDNASDAKLVTAGTKIFVVGDRPDCMYTVLEGEVEIYVEGEVVETVPAGGLFGEMAVIEDDRRAATAVAKTDVRLVAIDQPRFMELIQESPAFALRVMRVLSDRVRRLDQRLFPNPRP